MQITLTIKGLDTTTNKLTKLGLKLMMFDAAMGTIGEKLAKYYANEALLSQGSVFGAKWQRLMAATTKYKSKHYAGAPPEVRTGALQGNFDYEASSKEVHIFNKSKYFEFQNSGTSRLPARQMIGVNKPVNDMIVDVIQADIDQKLRML